MLNSGQRRTPRRFGLVGHTVEDQPAGVGRSDSRTTRVLSAESSRLASVADACGVEVSVVERVFADDEGELKLILPARFLAKATRGAMRQIAILTVCARQAGGWDSSWTAASAVRAVCEGIDVFSSKHFAAVMDSLDMFSGQGAGSNRQFRAHDKSFAAARDIIAQFGLLAE